MQPLSNQQLAIKANEARILGLTMVHDAASGHPGGSMSCLDLVTALYFNVMHVDTQNPQDPDRDRFVMSKGHCSPALYPVLALRGFFPVDELHMFRRIDGHMSGHVEMHHVRGVDMSTGSLGQGVSAAVGMALGGKLNHKDYRVYTVMGDGELDEGQGWEAFMSAAKYKLDNLCVIVDVNGLQIDGATKDVMPLDPLDQKFAAFGFHVITINGHTFHEGDWMSIDGSTGNIYGEAVATVPADPGSGYFGRLMGWADKYRQLMVYTNADTPRDAAQGRAFGAQGIGLCRTEHMFFEGERIKAMREMIVADNTEDRKKALAKIMPYQQGDFEGLYEAMEGCPVVIRFLDPPLHEFLPTDEADIELLAKDMGKTVAEIKAIIASLHEFNPMMGHRGCRLAVSYPEIAEMQTTAVINAAINVQKKHPDWKMVPEIMIPLVGEVKELKYVKDVVVATADKIIKDAGIDMKYEVGTMIEIPRAALTADEIAKEAEFFSFGTNDLTQMTFGFSRDDAGKFLSYYYDKKIYESDPFAHLDQNGVGKLVAMAAKLGKETRPDIHLGICGEHGGDPTSVEFCHKVGLNYVSCSPYRVPIARLAAAQAAIKHPRAN